MTYQISVFEVPKAAVSAQEMATVRSALRQLPCEALVVLVGANPGCPDFNALFEGFVVHRLDSPLFVKQGRRFPDVRTSGDAVEFAWSLAVMDFILTIGRERGVACVELPSRGALAYAIVQERATTSSFDDVLIRIRFDGLRLMETGGRGRNPTSDDLMVMDMERMAIELCDALILDGHGSSRFLRKVYGDLFFQNNLCTTRRTISVPLASSTAPNVLSSIICAGTELGSLRQCVRAVLGSVPSCTHDVFVDCDPVLFREAGFPAELRLADTISSDAARTGWGRIIILADAWSADGALAWARLAEGCVVVVNDNNPAYDDPCWSEAPGLRRYDGSAADLSRVLEEDFDWSGLAFDSAITIDDNVLMRSRHAHAEAESQTRCVSVVIPCFNMGAWIRYTVMNVMKFDWDDLDIVIVDDGSTDDVTLEVLRLIEAGHLEKNNRGERKLRILRLPFNQGLSAARNAGISVARGAYTVCIDADDLLCPSFVDVAVSALERNPGHDFVVPRVAYFMSGGEAGGVDGLHLGRALPLVGAALESGTFANRFSTATCLVRTKVLRRVKYDENLRSYEDWQLYRRALAEGCRFLITNDVMFYYRLRPDSMIHDPAMRSRHARLYSEMSATQQTAATRPVISWPALGVLAAPEGLEGSSRGLLLSGFAESIKEMESLRRSRIVGLAYRLSALIRRVWK